MNSENEYEEDGDEKESSNKMLLEMGEDEVLHLHKEKPGVLFEFDTEDALYKFMSTVAKAGISKQGDRCLVKNVSTDFFNRFEPIDLG